MAAETIEHRFWSKVCKTEDCWTWKAACDPKGYGRFFRGRGMALAHRVSWELAHGPIPEGMDIDHICHNHGCVRPEHLRPATRQDNAQYRRGALNQGTSSGIRNVYWHKRAGKWMAQIKVDYRLVYLGLYESKEEAAAAAAEARRQHFTFADYEEAR